MRALIADRALRATIVILVAFACLGFVGFTARAETGIQWKAPLNLSDEYAHPGWFPTVHADRFGRVHVLWQGEVPDGEGKNALYYVSWNGQEWSDVNDLVIAPPTAWTIRSALASDPMGDLHLIYRRRATIYYQQAPVDRARSAGAWTGRKQFSATDSGYICDIALDSQGVLHAVWAEVSGCDGNCGDIFYRRSTDLGLTWSYPQILSEGLAYDAALQLECGRTGTVLAIWDTVTEDGARQCVTLRASSDSGETWDPPVSFGSADEPAYQGAAAISGRGQIVVVWHPVVGENIYYQTSDDGGVEWSEPAPIPDVIARPENTPPYDRFDMLTDSTGLVHLLAVGAPASGEDPTTVYHCRWDGVEWLDPLIVYHGPGFPEFPSLSLASGSQLHAVWFTREKLWGQSLWEVWHSQAEIDAPPATPVALPTLTPTRVPTLAPTSTPTLTPTPLADPTIRQMDWRRNANLPLLAGFVVTVVLSSSVLALKQMRRR